jgi:hypothetical protein
VHHLGTAGTRVGTLYLFSNAQPLLGPQEGTGRALETTRLWSAWIGVVGLVVSALATKPANTTEKIDAWTKSFMVWLPPGGFVTIFCGERELKRV